MSATLAKGLSAWSHNAVALGESKVKAKLKPAIGQGVAALVCGLLLGLWLMGLLVALGAAAFFYLEAVTQSRVWAAAGVAGLCLGLSLVTIVAYQIVSYHCKKSA